MRRLAQILAGRMRPHGAGAPPASPRLAKAHTSRLGVSANQAAIPAIHPSAAAASPRTRRPAASPRTLGLSASAPSLALSPAGAGAGGSARRSHARRPAAPVLPEHAGVLDDAASDGSGSEVDATAEGPGKAGDDLEGLLLSLETHASPSGITPPHSPVAAGSEQMVERLGGLMALLGPRYRTLPKDFLWERATVGERGRFKREELKMHALAASREAACAGLPRAPGGRWAGAAGLKGVARPKREELPLPLSDPDSRERKGYLASRSASQPGLAPLRAAR